MIDVLVTDDQADHTIRGADPDGTGGEILPARIGRYTIERKLSQGGMGVVYAARDDRLERTIALKTLSAVTHDGTARQRLWREAKAAASINHPNVCQIYEIGEDAGRVYIAMELLDSVSYECAQDPGGPGGALPGGMDPCDLES